MRVRSVELPAPADILDASNEAQRLVTHVAIIPPAALRAGNALRLMLHPADAVRSNFALVGWCVLRPSGGQTAGDGCACVRGGGGGGGV